jgi:S-adenosylmethionine:tRNA ribosyltransferase-isomerase
MNSIPVVDLASFQYDLPKDKIALYPVTPRDSSKLLYFNQDQNISSYHFYDLKNIIPQGATIVFNETKVVKARLLFTTETNATIEVFCLEPPAQEEQQIALASHETVLWKCFVGNAKKWKQEFLTLNVNLGSETLVLTASIAERLDDAFIIRFHWNLTQLTWGEVLEAVGKLPLPPYIKRVAEEEDEATYQTVYAAIQGSVAAPTAGLHFSDQVLNDLQQKGCELLKTTLHVGAGTFKPIKALQVQEHRMHAEEVIIKKQFIEDWLQRVDIPMVAVGTTSVRCLESMYWLGVKLKLNQLEVDLDITQWYAFENAQVNVTLQESLQALLDWFLFKKCQEVHIKTAIMIVPGYQFKVVNYLITNFHQPDSTLMLLIGAFIGEHWKKVYDFAIKNDYRFLSYGDSSLLTRSC